MRKKWWNKIEICIVSIVFLGLLKICIYAGELYQETLPVGNTVAQVSDTDAKGVYNQVLQTEKKDDAVIAVACSTDWDFQINPLNSLGNRQITSKEYYIVNNGTQDVRVTIQKLSLIVSQEIDVSKEPVTEADNGTKKIYLCLSAVSDWMDNQKKFLIANSGDSISFVLSPDPEADNHYATFEIVGNASCITLEDWKDEDVRMEMQLDFQNCGKVNILEQSPTDAVEMSATDALR